MVNMSRERDPSKVYGLLQGQGHQNQQRELIILGELSGIDADPAVYRIIIELLSQQIEPEAIYKLLRQIRRSKSGKQSNAKNPAVIKRK